MKQIEHQEQVKLIKWFSFQYPRLRIYAVPNGGQRHVAVAAKLKLEGVQAGVPDLCLPIAKKGCHALYIEMKAPKGRLTDSQKEWAQYLTECGNLVVTCYGFEEAKQTINDYLNEKA